MWEDLSGVPPPGRLCTDIKKLGNIPDGGSRLLGKPEGIANRHTHRGQPRKGSRPTEHRLLLTRLA